MVNLFKKILAKKISIVAPATGELLPITAVSDKMFAQKIMGDGYAVKPTEGKIYAPITGTVVSVFPTKHAINFSTPDGLEILLHLGVDTVDLKGAPFDLTVTDGQEVVAGDCLGTMDLTEIAKAGKSDEIILVFTNMDKIKNMTPVNKQQIIHSEEIGTITLA